MVVPSYPIQVTLVILSAIILIIIMVIVWSRLLGIGEKKKSHRGKVPKHDSHLDDSILDLGIGLEEPDEVEEQEVIELKESTKDRFADTIDEVVIPTPESVNNIPKLSKPVFISKKKRSSKVKVKQEKSTKKKAVKKKPVTKKITKKKIVKKKATKKKAVKKKPEKKKTIRKKR